ncbi:MAG: hypothetical protein JKY95_10050 [Planctomycetaceae bacterium]|nr:hypothetical protein [Planctomycetaceae bacterium]
MMPFEISSQQRSLLNTLFLAVQSHQKQQLPGRDRFLLLTLITACKAGYPIIADRCREFIVQDSPHHLLTQYANAIEAMQSEEFQIFSKQIQRFCSNERAELLAQGLEFQPEQELHQHDHDVQQLADSLLNSMQ